MIKGKEVTGFLTYSNKSSAQRDTLCSTPSQVTPWKEVEARKVAERGSVDSANSKGDKGQPCRVSCSRAKLLEWVSLVQTLAWGEMYKRRIQEQNLFPNQNFLGTKKLLLILMVNFRHITF